MKRTSHEICGYGMCVRVNLPGKGMVISDTRRHMISKCKRAILMMKEGDGWEGTLDAH
jgi:hypothetical protein